MNTAALMVALVLSAPPKPAARPATVEDATVKKARELFQRGQALYKQARYGEALAQFEEAYLVRPHPVIYFNLGKCHEQLGDIARAMRAYRDYLRLAPEAPDRSNVTDAIGNLERRLAERGLQQLLVLADPSSATIEVDGKGLGNSPASVELKGGNHMLAVTAPGYERVERSFVMSTARATEMTINLRPLVQPRDPGPLPPPPPLVDAPRKEDPVVATALTPTSSVVAAPPPPPPSRKGKAFTWVAGGVALVGAGTAVGLGLAGNATAERYNATPVSDPTKLATYASARGLETGTNVAWVTAGVAAAAAVVLLILE